jgi:hypothetical protein
VSIIPLRNSRDIMKAPSVVLHPAFEPSISL